MDVAGYHLHWDALLARVIYRWHWKIALSLLLVGTACGLASGLIPPVWRGRVELAIAAPPGAVVTVDGRPWPRELFAGRHTVRAELPDGRAAWAELTLRAGEPLSLTLPAGLREPRERPLPPVVPGGRITEATWADGSWRLVSAPPPADAPDAATPPAGQTLAVGPATTERLTTIDAYAGLADQVHVGGRLVEAIYEPARETAGSSAAGAILIRGWPGGAATVPLSLPVTLVRLAPDGAALLFAERTPAGGERVSVLVGNLPPVPVVAVPGAIRLVEWSPDGAGAVLHSEAAGRLALTLVRTRPSLAAATVADLDARCCGAARVPLTWDAGALLWVAPDSQGTSALWQAPLAALVPERRMPTDARAIEVLPGGALRIVRVVGEAVVVGRQQGELFIGERVLRQVPPAADLAGVWHGDELLLQSEGRAWLLHFGEEE